MGIAARSPADIRPHLQQGKLSFCALFDGLYLLHRQALFSEAADPGGGGVVSFNTVMARSEADGAQPFLVPFVTAIAKGDNPFSQRISVGRASNCDIVFRLPFVSKVHAHFRSPETGQWTLTDAKSSCGTFVDDVRLEPGVAKEVRVGADVRFGSLTLRLCNGSVLYDEVAPLVR